MKRCALFVSPYGPRGCMHSAALRGCTRSASAVGQQCLAVRKALINDCGAALWFPDDATTTAAAAVVAAAAAAAAADGLSANGTSKTAAASGTNTSAASTPCAYAVPAKSVIFG